MLVSVITPNYNAADFLERCVLSVAGQGIESLEHIIIDDGSSDNSKEILEKLVQDHGHLKVVYQKNQGAGVARNFGINEARGRFISFLDADDYWLENKLKSQISFMESKDIAFSYGDYFIESNESKRRKFIAPESLNFKDLLTDCPIGCLTVCYDTDKIGKCYMPEVRRGQDWALWLLILKKGIVAEKYPGLYATYTVNSESLSSNKIKKAKNIYNIYRSVFGYNLFFSSVLTLKHAFNVIKNRKRVSE